MTGCKTMNIHPSTRPKCPVGHALVKWSGGEQVGERSDLFMVSAPRTLDQASRPCFHGSSSELIV